MSRLTYVLSSSFLLLGLVSSPYAEEIIMPPANTESAEFSVQVPGRGMTMESVQTKFGEAQSREEAVGTPPITKWNYSEFSVYFESEFVIHAVVNK
ncbi:MAG: hypothetical protein QM484_09450 [Woeseiaceae bacterium]